MVRDVFPRDGDVKVRREGLDVNAGVGEVFTEVVKETLVVWVERGVSFLAPVVVKPAGTIRKHMKSL